MKIPDKWLALADAIIVRDAAGHVDLVRHAHDPRVRVATAAAFVACGPVRHSASKADYTNSYALKHDAERWGAMLGFSPYVNGDDLVAVCRAFGIAVRPHCPSCSDCMIALKPETLWAEGRRHSYAEAIDRLLQGDATSSPTQPYRPGDAPRLGH